MARHPDDVQVQVLMTPEMRKALAKTVLANQDDVPRKKLMDRGPMILYAMSWFMAQPKEDQLAILLTAMVDGLWLELSLDASSFGADSAAAMVERAVAALI